VQEVEPAKTLKFVAPELTGVPFAVKMIFCTPVDVKEPDPEK
jgi:hypothetical protein